MWNTSIRYNIHVHVSLVGHAACHNKTCFWGLYGQHNLQHGQLMTTEVKHWIYVVSNIGPTSPLWAELRCSNVCFQRNANELSDVGTPLGQRTISLAQCWAYVGYTLISTSDQRRPYEQNYLVPMLVFKQIEHVEEFEVGHHGWY